MMSVSHRQRILQVYHGETPDVVPFMLDLSHWFYSTNHLPWDLSQSYEEPERELVGYHRKMGVGFYMPNLASFYAVKGAEDVKSELKKELRDGNPEITWRYVTPLGTIERTRVWEENTYSWGIRSWSIKSEQDLKALGYALKSRAYSPRWDRYDAWMDCVGDEGVIYVPAGYSAMGQLLNSWMGIEGVMYATYDWPDTMREFIDSVNENNLKLIDLLTESPAEVILMGDNFSSDIQPPSFFDKWSRPYYQEAIRRLHAAGKFVAVHVDGRLQGAIGMIRDVGADCADAVTPTPTGDLVPKQCRSEAGCDFILSGGISPDLWLPRVPIQTFRQGVIEWLDLKKESPRLIANAGDQVPPGAEEDRIKIMRDLVEEHGRY